MCKPLLFYTITDYTNEAKICKRKGLKPYQQITKTLDGKPFPVVTHYSKGGYVYKALEYSQCYSGYMTTLMRLPKMSYHELLNVALTSNSSDERAGATGIILKEHPNEFEQYLISAKDMPLPKKERKQFDRLVHFILDFVCEYTSYVQERKRILTLCKDISTQWQ